MDAYLHCQDDRLVEIDVDRDAGHVPHAPRWAAAPGAGDGRMAPAHLPNRAGRALNRCATRFHGRRPSSGHNRVAATSIPQCRNSCSFSPVLHNIYSEVSTMRFMVVFLSVVVLTLASLSVCVLLAFQGELHATR